MLWSHQIRIGSHRELLAVVRVTETADIVMRKAKRSSPIEQLPTFRKFLVHTELLHLLDTQSTVTP